MATQFQVDLASAEHELTQEMKSVANLCANWPTVKQVLQAISSAIKNPFVKIALTIVIAAGDAICGKK